VRELLTLAQSIIELVEQQLPSVKVLLIFTDLSKLVEHRKEILVCLP
jgi:hypothetical protein